MAESSYLLNDVFLGSCFLVDERPEDMLKIFFNSKRSWGNFENLTSYRVCLLGGKRVTLY